MPHSDSAQTDLRDASKTRIENADSQTPESLPLGVTDRAVFALALSFEIFPRKIFAENGPFRVSTAFFIVGTDKLPFGGAAPVTARAAAPIFEAGSEGDPCGDKGIAEIVPAGW